MKEGMAWTLNGHVADYQYWSQVGKFSPNQVAKSRRRLAEYWHEDIKIKKKLCEDLHTHRPSFFINVYTSEITFHFVPDILINSDDIDYSKLLLFYYEHMNCDILEHTYFTPYENNKASDLIAYCDEEGWLKPKQKFECFKFAQRLICGNSFLFPKSLTPNRNPDMSREMVEAFLEKPHDDSEFFDLFVRLHEVVEFVLIDDRDRPNLNPTVVTIG